MRLIDAGPLVAAGDRDSDRHRPCTQAITGTRPPRYVPGTVVAEVCHLLAREAGTAAEAQFLDLLASGFLTPVALTAEDYRRAAQLVRRYADLPLGGVDASLGRVSDGRWAISGMISVS